MVDTSVTRRDFLDGAALALGGALVARPARALGVEAGASYPPALTGLRGSHEGSFETAHALRDPGFWATAGPAEETGEVFDLVVVGAGISGLAAGHFFRRQAGPAARVLILDNHDDFGGHARRNEFRAGGRLLLANGGAQSLESPGRWSPVAKGLLRELSVDVGRVREAFDEKLYPSLGLRNGVFFDRGTFGADALVAGLGERPWGEFFADAPLTDAARRDLVRVHTEKVDYLRGLAPQVKRRRLARTSYADFLTGVAGLRPDALPFFRNQTHDLWGVGVEAVSALDCLETGDDFGRVYPGFQGLGLGEGDPDEPYVFHFPDGNSSLARLLLRALIPEAAPGRTMDDALTRPADYARLDVAGWPVRLRLEATAVRVRHLGPPERAREVEVAYVKGGRLRSVRAGACVLACWHGVVPSLLPELGAEQREALAASVKVPLVYANVLVRNWQSFVRLGVHRVFAPGGYWSMAMLDFPVSLGAYRCSREPNEPAVVFLVRTPCSPGLPPREQHRAGRVELLGTSFADFEREIRGQLERMLGPGGFHAARDVLAITVNRWPHGYTYEYSPLWDPEWPAGRAPHEIARRRLGRVAIANADAGARAYADASIDQAQRAVAELLA